MIKGCDIIEFIQNNQYQNRLFHINKSNGVVSMVRKEHYHGMTNTSLHCNKGFTELIEKASIIEEGIIGYNL